MTIGPGPLYGPGMGDTQHKAKAGWKQDPVDPTLTRYWTGDAWASRVEVIERPAYDDGGWDPEAHLFLGVVLLFVGIGIVLYGGFDEVDLPQVIGALITIPGWIFLAIGIIAKGVQVGRRG